MLHETYRETFTGLAESKMLHFLCPVPVKVQTDTQTCREIFPCGPGHIAKTYRNPVRLKGIAVENDPAIEAHALVGARPHSAQGPENVAWGRLHSFESAAPQCSTQGNVRKRLGSLLYCTLACILREALPDEFDSPAADIVVVGAFE